ncbi:unnamed protein product [Rhizoctonia solani]|uniref:Peptidase C14 caspase domain-containing protein n=1 Tax=Rhizoctonia solani TaxID=456999 RepID=A0A8H2WPJ4_9AGAM|nr:unnamed protein product [Rhizoctonia solani]
MSRPSFGSSLGPSSPKSPGATNRLGWIESSVNVQLPIGSTPGDSHMFTRVSNCTGKKKALCIGINYRGIQPKERELDGCINDANSVAEFLTQQFGFQRQNIVKLTDDATDPYLLPTKANIISAMNWLVKDARPDDSLFFHFSGHGGQVADLDGDEIDGHDEVIYPVDFEASGHIDDDTIHDLIVRPLPPGCRLTALFDCSHSGTALDLPYVYTSRGKTKEPSRWVDAGQGLLDAGRSTMRGDMKGMFKGFGNMFKSETRLQKKAARHAKETRTNPADIVAWAACKDFEQSDDVVDDGKAIGAISYAFTEALKRQHQQSYQELLNNIRELVRDKCDQKPQLTSSHPIIGINYRDVQHEELQGCVNDANSVAEFLSYQLGFQKQNIIKLTDDTTDPDRLPTRANIISAMNWLVKDARPGDSLFFHFSGHGGQTEDLEGDEIDGYDEVIYPVDFEENGHIDDDMMHDLIVQPLPSGCRLTALIDCSHAGSALDLPYVYTSRGRIKKPSRWTDVGQGLLEAGRSSMRGDMKSMLKGFGNDNKAIGAMSHAFTDALRRQPQQTYQELLNNIRDLIHDKYDQKPQLSSSHPILVNPPLVAPKSIWSPCNATSSSWEYIFATNESRIDAPGLAKKQPYQIFRADDNDTIASDAWCSSPSEQQALVDDIMGYFPEEPVSNNAPPDVHNQRLHDRDQGSTAFEQSSQAPRLGRRKALCIGINYIDIGSNIELQGCINDVHRIANFLTVQFGYKTENIWKLTDDAVDPRYRPTRENIITAMHWLVEDAQPTDSLFFHFSGHGGQTKDLDGDEADGFDEVIYPLDYENVGHIVDDDMHEIMVKPLPAGCRLTAIFDCSHSGSALDLPYTYSTDGKLKEHSQLVETGRGLLSVGKFCARGNMSGAIKGLGSVIRSPTSRRARKQATQRSRELRTSAADVVSWAACKDSEKSDDAIEGDEAVGAMSYAFIEALRQKPRQSYRELLNNVRTILRAKYQQKPQLSSSHPIDTNNWFIA